jgi:Ca-activated chloride channel family protein
LERLSAGGSTNGGAGIELAYALAREHFDRNGINRVILATDGDFNVGTTSEGDLVRMIEKKREEGIELSVLGFGTGNINDRTMEQLADKGNGNYAYIDTLDEARKVLVDEVGATLVTVAKDVKIQVEFNPEQVAQYRLIGYENRKMAHRDFKDDRKDAGEVGAGHTVTALYELTPTSAGTSRPSVEPLRYQANTRLPRASDSAELMHVKVRFKAPKGTRSELMTFPVFDERHEFATTTPDFRFAAAVASYAMVLKNSKYRGIANLRDIESWANDGLKSAGMGREQLAYRQDFVALIRETRRVLDRNN